MYRFRVYGLTCVLMLLAGSAARATTIVLPTDEQLIAKSPVIVEGTVLSSMPIEANGAIYTETVVSVSRNIKGETGDDSRRPVPRGRMQDRAEQTHIRTSRVSESRPHPQRCGAPRLHDRRTDGRNERNLRDDPQEL